MSQTYTITIECEVKMTSPGSPPLGPSYSSGGEPAEPPEFEIESITVDGGKETVEAIYKKLKEERGPYAISPSYDQFFADLIYDKVLDKAAEDDWGEFEYPEPAMIEKGNVMEPIMQFFAYAHLPIPLQLVSEPFGKLAIWTCDTLPRNPERTVALRKLLEAKDAAVRAYLFKEG